MSKIYVIDTSVLLSAGRKALYSYPGSEIVIPLVCVRELESKRSDPSLGYEARMVLRELEELREIGDLKTGVWIENNTKIRVEINHVGDIPTILKAHPSNDTQIITVAHGLAKEAEAGDEVVLVSKDIPLKIVASLVNVATEDFIEGNTTGEFIDDIEYFDITGEEMAALYKDGTIKLEIDVPLNVGVVLRSGTGSALAIAKTQYEFRLIKETILHKTVSGKSAEQRIAIEQLMDPTIKCVSLGGVPGGGKSMLALAAGVEQLGKEHKKIIVFRSMHAVGGEELGFLPGTEQEKMDPWTAAVFDSLESFLTKRQIDEMKTKQQLQVLPLTHIRGRTLNDAFIIVDEAQNLEKSVILTVLSRLGHGSKAVLTWDIAQRDNLHVGRYDGVYNVVSRMLGHKLFAHTSMKKSERSEFAQAVSSLLDDYK